MNGGQWIYRKEVNGEWIWHHGDGKRMYDDYSNLTDRQLIEQLRARGLPTSSVGGQRLTKQERLAMLRSEDNVVDLSQLGDRQYYVIQQGDDRVRNFIGNGVDEGSGVRINESMSADDWRTLEDDIATIYGDTPDSMPQAIRTFAPKETEIRNVAMRKFTDWMFEILGTIPTRQLFRQPLARLVYHDELARFYVHADGDLRAHLRQTARTNGIEDQFDVMVNKWAGHYGFKKLPDIPESPLDMSNMKELDLVAKNKALNKTKDLLYDLSRSSNAADAARLVAPFADAWWEVLTRWGRLLNPYMNEGQAIRNLRRPAQLATTARREGWFSEDQFGNETFTWLPAKALSRIFPGGQGAANLDPRIAAKQLFFIDPGSPRSAFLPGLGPVWQIPASMLRPKMPTWMRDVNDFVAFGDFSPIDTSDLGSVISGVLPSTYKRLIDRLFSGEFDNEYADETTEIMEMLYLSSDPRYNPLSEDGRRAAIEEARQVAGHIATMRIVNAFASPAQPRWSPTIAVRDAFKTDNPEQWINMEAFRTELRIAEEVYGSRELARQYIIDRWGKEPLLTTGGSISIKPRPVSKEAFREMEAHPELEQFVPLTAMAWLDESPDDGFFFEAWRQQFIDGTRETVTADMAQQIISIQLGNQAFRELSEQRDELLRQGREKWGSKSAGFRDWRDNHVGDWYRDEKDKIALQFYAWEDGKVVGADQRATYGVFMRELQSVAETESAYDALAAYNPQLAGFYRHAWERWREAEVFAKERGLDTEWWRTSSTSRPLKPGEVVPAEQTRRWFEDSLAWYVNHQMTPDSSAQRGAQWLWDRVFKGLLEDRGFEDTLLLTAERPPSLERSEQNDTISP
jgi:hypothetical protein